MMMWCRFTPSLSLYYKSVLLWWWWWRWWWWYEAEREFWEFSFVCFFCFFEFFTKTNTQWHNWRQRGGEKWKARIFLSQNRFFSPNCQKVHEKEATQTHTNVFPQHHKNDATSIIMFASSFNAVRSSPSIISKNVSSKSSRSSSNRSSTVKVRAMGMKKGSLLFSFSSSRVVIHPISTRRFQKWMCFFFSFPLSMKTMKRERWTKIDIDRFMQSTTKGMMRADPIGMIVSSSGSFLLLSSVFVCRRHFFRIITDRD